MISLAAEGGGECVVGPTTGAHRVSQPGVLTPLGRVRAQEQGLRPGRGLSPVEVHDHVAHGPGKGDRGHCGIDEVGEPVGSRTHGGLDVARGDRHVMGIEHALVRIDAPQAGGLAGYDERADDCTPVHQPYDDMAGVAPEQWIEPLSGKLTEGGDDHRVRLARLGGDLDTGGPEELLDVGQAGSGDPADHGDLPADAARARPTGKATVPVQLGNHPRREGILLEWLSLEEQGEGALDPLGARQNDAAAVVQPDLEVVEAAPDHAQPGGEVWP